MKSRNALFTFSKVYDMKNRINKEGRNSMNTSSARPSNKGLPARSPAGQETQSGHGTSKTRKKYM
jgi:hypothetical protein